MAFLFGVVKGAEIIKREQKKNRARNSIISAPGTSPGGNNDNSTLTIEPDWWDSGSTAVIAPKLDQEDEQKVPSVEMLTIEQEEELLEKKNVTDEDELCKEEKPAIATATTTATMNSSKHVKRHRPPRVLKAPAGSFSAAEIQRERSRISDDGKNTVPVQPRTMRVRSSPTVMSMNTKSGSYFEQLQQTKSTRPNVDRTASDAGSGELQRTRTLPRPKTQYAEHPARRSDELQRALTPPRTRNRSERPTGGSGTPSQGSFAEALSQNRTKVKSNAQRTRVASSATASTSQSRVERNMNRTPAAGSFLEATTVKEGTSNDNEAGSWEEFISSVSQDHKSRTKSGR